MSIENISSAPKQPAESASQDKHQALDNVIQFPAPAQEDQALLSENRSAVIERLRSGQVEALKKLGKDAEIHALFAAVPHPHTEKDVEGNQVQESFVTLEDPILRKLPAEMLKDLGTLVTNPKSFENPAEVKAAIIAELQNAITAEVDEDLSAEDRQQLRRAA